jgi:hypothetical protein
MNPCTFISSLISECGAADRQSGLSDGTVLIQTLALGASLAGRQLRFLRAEKEEVAALPLVVLTDDQARPGWMDKSWQQVLEFQDEMERTEKALIGGKMKPHEHRELKRKRDVLKRLGFGFTKELDEVERRLSCAKLTVNIDLAHEVARWGGRRLSERPPVGGSLAVLASGKREIASLISSSHKPGGLWNPLGPDGLPGYSIHAWCHERVFRAALAPKAGAKACHLGFLLRAPAETRDSRILLDRRATSNFLWQWRNLRISGRNILVAPFPDLADNLDQICKRHLDGLPEGLTCQGRHTGLTDNLVWKFASILLTMLVGDLDAGDPAAYDVVTLSAALAQRLQHDHLSALSEIESVGRHGPLPGLHQSIIHRLREGPATIRAIQRRQRYVQKDRCVEALGDLVGLGLIEVCADKSYQLRRGQDHRLSEILSGFLKKYGSGEGDSEGKHCEH